VKENPIFKINGIKKNSVNKIMQGAIKPQNALLWRNIIFCAVFKLKHLFYYNSPQRQKFITKSPKRETDIGQTKTARSEIDTEQFSITMPIIIF
jgi:hypothetical protein